MADGKKITVKQFRDFAAQADERLDSLEARVATEPPTPQTVTIASNGWTQNSGDTNFPYKYVSTAEGVTAASRVDVVLDAASVVIASNCGVCTTSETADNAVILKSRMIPTADLTGLIYITKTAAAGGT